MQVVVDKLNGFCKMKAIGYDNLRMIFIHGNDDAFRLLYRVNGFPVHDNANVQKAKQYLLFARDDDMVRR
jgi:hypothetical protein